MKVSFSERSLRSFRDAPVDIQRAILKQTRLLVRNLHHPSLRAKKYSQSETSGKLVSARIGGSISRSKATPTTFKASPRTRNSGAFPHPSQRWCRSKVLPLTEICTSDP